jgi:hypothetical protein
MKPQRSPNQNLTVRNQGPNDSKVRGGDNALIGSLLRPAATTKRRVVSRCFTLFHVVSRCFTLFHVVMLPGRMNVIGRLKTDR